MNSALQFRNRSAMKSLFKTAGNAHCRCALLSGARTFLPVQFMSVVLRTRKGIALLCIALGLAQLSPYAAIPTVGVSISNNGGIRLSWSSSATGFVLEE